MHQPHARGAARAPRGARVRAKRLFWDYWTAPDYTLHCISWEKELAGELEKIVRYQAKGDVASWSELARYLTYYDLP